MKSFLEILYCRNIPIWVDVVDRDTPVELDELNFELSMFGDKLLVKEITNRRILFGLRGRQTVFAQNEI